MYKKLAIFAGVLPAALFLVTQANSKDDGVMPSGSGSSTSMTRNASNSCGNCHGSRAQPSGVVVTVTPTARVLDPGQTIGITVAAKNPAVSSNTGGFAADVSAGALIAGSTSKIRGDGLAITHRNRNQRTWAFNYKAPTTPGLVEFYTVGLTSNGDGKRDAGDKYAFHGSDPANTVSTPVRMFVNAPAIKPVGSSCDDGYGNYSVLGASTTAKLGTVFQLEAHGLPTAASALLMISVGANVPGFDMGVMGAPGCVLRTAMLIEVPLITSGGAVSRSEGKLVLPLPVPNDAKLKGLVLSIQVGALDAKPKRAFPMIVTNAIEATIN